MNEKSKSLFKNFLEAEKTGLSAYTGNFIGILKDSAFEEIQQSNVVKGLRDELTSLYHDILFYLNNNDRECLDLFDEVMESLVFISSYIAYSHGWRDAGIVYSSLYAKISKQK